MVNWVLEQKFITAFSYIAFVLVSIPLWWHLEAWNVGCCLYIFWAGSAALIQAINMTIWADNAINWAPVWCDITSRWIVAQSMGVIIASFIINRRLYLIASVSQVSTSRQERLRAMYFDLALGFGVPIIWVGLYWFIQGHRFDIYEGIGCFYAIPNTILSWFVMTIAPIIVGLISGTYCILTLRAFFKRRKQFNELMTSNNTLTFNRYFRLMGLASVEVVATVPLGLWVLITNCLQPIYVWRGLGDLHSGFSRVDQFPAIEWTESLAAVQGFEFDCWMTVIMPVIFFAFFGVADEARRNYKLALSSVAKRVGLSTTWLDSRGASASKGGSSGFGKVTIPSFVQRGPRRQHQSVGSFTDKLSVNISIEDVVAYDGSLKEPKAAYAPSEHSGSSGSSTYFPSPTDEKGTKTFDSEGDAPLPSPAPAYNVDLERSTPDVPSSVPTHTVDMA